MCPDNAPALSDYAGEVWKVRCVTKEACFECACAGDCGWLCSMWYPCPDLAVETCLVPTTQEAPLWHLRVYCINMGHALLSAESGFAIYSQDRDDRALSSATGDAFWTFENGSEARGASKVGALGIAELSQAGRAGKALQTDVHGGIEANRDLCKYVQLCT